jgi:hypothetical protein
MAKTITLSVGSENKAVLCQLNTNANLKDFG